MRGSSPRMTGGELHHRTEVADRAAGGGGVGRGDDGGGVDAVVGVEVLHRASLAEVLDAERLHAVAAHAAEPGQRRRVAVQHGDEAGVAVERGERKSGGRARVWQYV